MSLQSVNSSSYTNLQSVIEAAKQRTKAAESVVENRRSAEDSARLPKAAVGGSLFTRLYGSKVEEKDAAPVRLGTRFDQYA